MLLLVGMLDPRYVRQVGRTKSYSELDYGVLRQVLDSFNRVIVTPHVLTEVSNLSTGLDSRLRYNFFQVMAALLDEQPGRLVVHERHRPARTISKEEALIFYRLGLTDAAIVHFAAHRRCLVLTDDTALGEVLTQRRIDILTLADLAATAST